MVFRVHAVSVRRIWCSGVWSGQMDSRADKHFARGLPKGFELLWERDSQLVTPQDYYRDCWTIKQMPNSRPRAALLYTQFIIYIHVALQSTTRLFLKICHAVRNTPQYSSGSRGAVNRSYYTHIIVSTSVDMQKLYWYFYSHAIAMYNTL
jgi:hypothetical protein